VEWFADKGYGFIKPYKQNSENIFVHVSQVAGRTHIVRGSIVSFRSSFDNVKKSDTAFDVKVLDRLPRDNAISMEAPNAYRESRVDGFRQRSNGDVFDYQHTSSLHAPHHVWHRNPVVLPGNISLWHM